ncbi:MAG TPA: 30S ribosomal protein S1 [Candidatus Anoxymicrobiaceae bacterium]
MTDDEMQADEDQAQATETETTKEAETATESKEESKATETEFDDEDEESLITGAGAAESLASLGLPPEESQKVPDYDGTIKIFNEGDIVSGTVVRVDKEEVLLDIGYKSEGVIPARELSIRYDVKPADIVSTGDELEALVLQKEDKEGRLILSKKRAQYERAWGNIERIKDEDGIVEGEVIEVVKGGLILDIGLRGFLPASLVDMRRVKDLNQFLGRALEAKIIELDKNRNNVVLSRRAYLEKMKSTERKEFLESLEKGAKRTGSVSSIVNFGAFVDLGGVDGLIHISELSWSHVDHPSEVLAVGDEVSVEILDVDLERERVSLSLKKAQEDPWEKLAKEQPAGSTVHGKVTKLVPFGAFVEIAPGVEGLVHISELAWEHIEFPEEVVSVGEEVDAKIIDIDLDRRRISLSLKQLSAPGEVEYRYEDEEQAEPELVDAVDYEEQAAGEGEAPAPEPSDMADIASEAAEIVASVEDVELQVTAGEMEAVEEAIVEAVVEEAIEEAIVEEAIEEAVEEAIAEAVVEVIEEVVEEELEAELEAEAEAEIVTEIESEIEAVEPTEADVADASEEPEPAEAGEVEAAEELAEPGAEDGSLESILAEMKRKGQQE